MFSINVRKLDSKAALLSTLPELDAVPGRVRGGSASPASLLLADEIVTFEVLGCLVASSGRREMTMGSFSSMGVGQFSKFWKPRTTCSFGQDGGHVV